MEEREVFMWSDYYAAGGWGMHPVSLFGFLLVAASVLYVLRPSARYRRLVSALGVVTFAAGLLGTATGISTSAHYIERVEPIKQLEIFALGIDESLHNVVLALVLVVIAGLITAVGSLRPQAGPVASAN
jgi:hypothetical protein